MNAHRCTRYDPSCAGCRPVLLDAATGEKLADDHPFMVAALAVFEAAPLEDRAAFRAVTVDNSRRPADLERFQRMTACIAERCELSAKEPPS